MKLEFIGAAHEVTGSCTMLEACGKHVLIDCGMEQGADTYENCPIPVSAGEIDAILLTHAHIDHSEEFYEVCKMHEHELPPFDDFIRGWIGVGGGYDNGIICFASHIISDNVAMFDKAFSFIETALENGFSKEACLRGFGNKWEQKISEVLGEEGRKEKPNSLQERIASAKEKSQQNPTKPSKVEEKEY